MRIPSLLFACAVVALGAVPAVAQSSRSTDSLLRAGAIGPTEFALYDAVRTRPRDPAARVALGRYLVARGATRVGATLLEEAIRFGGDPAAIEPDLVRAYLATGEYRSLADLGSASAGDRERARWLVAHETRIIAPDSILSVALHASADSSSVGRIAVRINGRPLDAVISAHVSGLVVFDTAVASLLHRFSPDARGQMLAAADSLAIGGLTMSNVPVAIALRADQQTVVIGLDVIGQFVPTFDMKASQLTLRIGGPRVSSATGTRFATWSANSDLQLLQPGGWISVSRPAMARLLREHRWTFDSKRGQLTVEP